MNPEKWAAVCKYAAWFYQNTAFIRFDPRDRFAKSDRYREAGERIEVGVDPELVDVPGIGTHVVEPDYMNLTHVEAADSSAVSH